MTEDEHREIVAQIAFLTETQGELISMMRDQVPALGAVASLAGMCNVLGRVVMVMLDDPETIARMGREGRAEILDALAEVDRRQTEHTPLVKSFASLMRQVVA
jgi:hypothetical protein